MVFGLFRPKSPLECREKAWTEVRMRWLADEIGYERMTRAAVVLPTEAFFPESNDASPEAARKYLDRVASHLGIDAGSIRLDVVAAEDMPGVAGTFEPGTIRLARPILEDQSVLVATLAQELAHEVLQRRESLQHAPDREWVTDLLPVFFGMGVLAANATLHETYETYGHYSTWRVGRYGYLPSRMFGYALALFAWVRGEERPEWATTLRTDARTAFQSGLRYLQATGDSQFSPGTRHEPARRPLRTLIADLESGTPSACVAALWQIGDLGAAAEQAASAVGHLLRNRSPGIRAEAARALAALGPASEDSLGMLGDALWDSDEEVRAAVAYALGRLALRPELIVPELARRLEDSSGTVLMAASLSLAQYGPAAEPALPQLQAALRTALMTTRYSASDYLIHAIRSIAPDPERELQELLASLDSEIQAQATALLQESHPIDPRGPAEWFGLFRR